MYIIFQYVHDYYCYDFYIFPTQTINNDMKQDRKKNRNKTVGGNNSSLYLSSLYIVQKKTEFVFF